MYLNYNCSSCGTGAERSRFFFEQRIVCASVLSVYYKALDSQQNYLLLGFIYLGSWDEEPFLCIY